MCVCLMHRFITEEWIPFLNELLAYKTLGVCLRDPLTSTPDPRPFSLCTCVSLVTVRRAPLVCRAAAQAVAVHD
jgi:hypothetical protein